MQTQGTQAAALSFAHAGGWYLQIPLIHALRDGPRLWDPMGKRSSQNTENSPKTSLTFIRNIRPPCGTSTTGKCTRWHDTTPLYNSGCRYALVGILMPRKDGCASKFNQHSKCHPQLRTQKSA